MKSLLKLRLVIFVVIVLQTLAACNSGMRSQTPILPKITDSFTVEGYTLVIGAYCSPTTQKCHLRAQVSSTPALYKLIEKVEYTFVPEIPKSPVLITDASTGFRFEGEHTAGGKVYAAVTLRPHDGVPSKVVRIEGTLPLAAEVTPPLTAGLRFEVKYRPWYLEGVPHEPVEYLFNIQLLGDSDALKRIKSVEYRLPDDESKRPRITHRVESDYFVEGSMPANKEDVVIITVIRWKSGEVSTHTIPLRPRL